MLKYYRCNIIGGFRLTDLNKFIKTGEFFAVDTKVVYASKALAAALKHNWITEVPASEGMSHVVAPSIMPNYKSSTQTQSLYKIAKSHVENVPVQKEFKIMPIGSYEKNIEIIDMNDFTFLIPIKIESQDRLNNLQIVISYLNNNFKTNLILCEQGNHKISSILESMKSDNLNITTLYLEDISNEEPIYRTKMLNKMAKIASTKFISIYDSDVIFLQQQYKDVIKTLRNNQADIVYPYDLHFYDVPKSYNHLIVELNSPGIIDKNFCGDLNPNSVGGAIFFNRQVFLDGGMENEHFVSFGPEDWERYLRFKTLGYRIKREKGCLFHLSHLRTKDSCDKNPYFLSNSAECWKIQAMSKDELKKYMLTWEWLK
jgi:hypothetical protein